MTVGPYRWKRLKSEVGVALFTFAASLGAAQASDTPSDPLPIEVEIATYVLETRTLPDGRKINELVPAGEIQEGQVVHYALMVRNPNERAAHNVVVTKPVPANTHYVADSAAAPGATVTFSVDGGQTFAPARELTVLDEQGLPKPASPERYTHIRWQLRYPLVAGAVAYARFRAVFE